MGIVFSAKRQQDQQTEVQNEANRIVFINLYQR
jgi:hypothetical protein